MDKPDLSEVCKGNANYNDSPCLECYHFVLPLGCMKDEALPVMISGEYYVQLPSEVKCKYDLVSMIAFGDLTSATYRLRKGDEYAHKSKDKA